MFSAKSDQKGYNFGEGEWSIPTSSTASVPKFVEELGSTACSSNFNEWQLHARIAYSGNHRAMKSVFLPAKSHLISLEQLIPSRDTLHTVLLTTFNPWSPAFLIDHIPATAKITLVCADEESNGSKTQETVWLCLHPDHGEKECNYCDVVIKAGDPYLKCLNCADVDFCMKCSQFVHDGMNIKQKMADSDHDPYSHVLEEVVHQTSQSCACSRKRHIEWISPPLVKDNYSIFHAKLMLLLYPTHLRVIISSFNLDQFAQWDSMTDSFWFQDFEISNASRTDASISSAFFEQLIGFIDACGASEWATRLSVLYPRLNTSHLSPSTYLIATIPSQCRPRSKYKFTGLPNIAAVLSKYSRYSNDTEVSPVFVKAFSVGGAAMGWLKDFAQSIGAQLDEASLRVVFHDGTFSFDSELKLRKVGCMWSIADEERGLRWHSKMMCRFWKHKACPAIHGWIYVGSHNLSKGSWGSASGECNLWELGIVHVSDCHSTPCKDLDMRSLAMPFSIVNLRLLSWKDNLVMKLFDGPSWSMPSVYAVVISIGSTSDSIDIAVIDLKSSKQSGKLFSLISEIWPTSICAFPPPISSYLQVRIAPQLMKVVWVERIFMKTEVRLGSQLSGLIRSTDGTKYVPPHKRR